MIKREENERSKKIKRIVLNIIVIIFLLVYGFIVIAPLFDMPMVRILKNFTGDLIHYLLRLAVLIFLIIHIIKCKEKVFKIIFSIILLSLTSIFIIRLIVDSVIHDEATLQKIDISKTESLESVYYPDESGFVEVVYKKKIIGTLYCQKTIYSISYGDKELDDINIPLEKYYDEIKDKKFGLCGLNLKHISTNYKNDDSNYDVKNAKTIILDDSIEVSGEKLDEKVRLVVYPTKNNNCKNEIRLYSQYENSNVYFVCIGEIEIIPHPNISHIETVKDNSKFYIDYITRQMNVKEKYRDGGSIMYERDNLRVLKCNTADGNKDIYIGYNNLEYKDGYCMRANLKNNKESKKIKNDNKSTYDELKAEFIGYANQFIIRSTYVFENNKAIACYMEIESDNELFLKPFPEDLSYLYDPLVKNVRYEGNKKYYEWSDEYFEEKGKGCSKAEIEDFLRDLGYTIIN